jgi:hypothetical protein
MAVTVSKGVTVKMTLDKETPGTMRYREEQAPGEPAVIGTLYVPKSTVKALGAPAKIVVSVEPA